MNQQLDTDGQIAKLSVAMSMALEASQSDDIARRLGASLLYAGIMDFLVIQAARLVEQIILKGQLSQGQQPAFQPHEDSYFYQQKISTRLILSGIRKLFPVTGSENTTDAEIQNINRLAKRMIDAGFEFLDYRNPIVHQIGRPDRTFDDVVTLCNKANLTFEKFRVAHKELFEAAAPYRFGQEELKHFYGDVNKDNP